MRTMLRILAALVVAATTLVGMPASASATTHVPHGKVIITTERVRLSPDGSIPYAGGATANVPGYDEVLWATTWKCTYAGWERITVVWRCELRDNATLHSYHTWDTRSGTFPGGTYDPNRWYYNGYGACVYAEAHYASYPSEGDHSYRCM